MAVDASRDAGRNAGCDAFDGAGLALERVAGLILYSSSDSRGRLEMDSHDGEQDVMLAALDDGTARALLETWAAAGPGRAWRDLRAKSGDIVQRAPAHVHGRGGRDEHQVVPHPDWPFGGGVFPDDLGVVAQRSVLTGAWPATSTAGGTRWTTSPRRSRTIWSSRA